MPRRPITEQDIKDGAKKLGIEKVRDPETSKITWKTTCTNCELSYWAKWAIMCPPQFMAKKLTLRGWFVKAGKPPMCPACLNGERIIKVDTPAETELVNGEAVEATPKKPHKPTMDPHPVPEQFRGPPKPIEPEPIAVAPAPVVAEQTPMEKLNDAQKLRLDVESYAAQFLKEIGQVRAWLRLKDETLEAMRERVERNESHAMKAVLRGQIQPRGYMSRGERV